MNSFLKFELLVTQLQSNDVEVSAWACLVSSQWLALGQLLVVAEINLFKVLICIQRRIGMW